jgi:adenosylhomocysteine nucleosidase
MMVSVLLLFFTVGQLSTIGIIGAMDEELVLIKQDMQIEHTDTIAQRIFTEGMIQDIRCVCVKAGVGKTNAALTAEILIMKYHVDAIIYSGVAGGINPDFDIGDIIISQRVLHHDFGQLTPDMFLPFDTLGFFADSFLLHVALNAAHNVQFDLIPQKFTKEKTRYPRVTLGVVSTGDQFISSEEKREWLDDVLHADCVEMEGAAVAQVCVINNVPFVIIRCLSDLANEEADIDFEAFLAYAAKNSSLVVKEMITLLKSK